MWRGSSGSEDMGQKHPAAFKNLHFCDENTLQQAQATMIDSKVAKDVSTFRRVLRLKGKDMTLSIKNSAYWGEHWDKNRDKDLLDFHSELWY